MGSKVIAGKSATCTGCTRRELCRKDGDNEVKTNKQGRPTCWTLTRVRLLPPDRPAKQRDMVGQVTAAARV